jgi:hypothetical protein
MGTNFTFYRILCTTPPDLEPERLIFESAVAEFVERVTMPDAVLFAPASLRPPIRAERQKPVIESNIRMCEFFLQIVGEIWPDPAFAGFVEFALASVADTSTATRKACVLFRNYASASDEVRRFRESLASGGMCELGDFGSADELPERLAAIFSGWYASLKPARA